MILQKLLQDREAFQWRAGNLTGRRITAAQVAQIMVEAAKNRYVQVGRDLFAEFAGVISWCSHE